MTSCRVTLALLTSVGYAFVYILRVDLSVAIVCMVKDPFINSTLDNNSVSIDNYSDYSDGCGGQAGLGSSPSPYKGEFEWNKEMRGIILGSFFYGYILTQVPGGWLTVRFGPKKVFGVAMVINVMATILTPIAARVSVYLVLVLRVLLGLCQGVCFPASHHMWGRWAPPLERSKLVSFSYAGTIFGTVVALSLSGFLCSVEFAGGWPLIFYIYGGACAVWCVAWFYLMHDTPMKHPRITQKERNLITSEVGAAVYHKSTHVPWKHIFKSPATWAIVTAHVCNNWGSYTVLTSIPMYMKEVLYFDMKSNGLLSAVPYMVMYVVSIFAGWFADFLRQRRILRTVTVRKMWQCISFWPPGVCIAAMGFMSCEHRYVSVMLLSATIALTAFGRSAYSVNHVDIAPRYGGALFSLSNTVATFPGFISPAVVAALTPNGSQAEWKIVFFSCGAVYAIGGVIYIIFARADVQSWATPSEIDDINIGEEELKEELKELRD
ncbi:hypothetical protein CAPTEDRAFT_209782 [Capitella teleta]|uniref:Sialin n=1 Tax=Capitella teleta TaxID=283909 RepID=R7T829_CAPTE|nr:hypothetical protein CAPTEDRAFT_209782 [Capitella teleta]|eukprot:ELT87580.1 hypothetical protein CAPTEDRAFT_209782 [Capitella teleta]